MKFAGDLTLAYRVCLWSRLANRILLPLATFNAKDADSLYKGVRKIKWLDHMKSKGSFVVDFSGVSPTIKNSQFGALKVKDAICDQIREKKGARPDIDKENPDIRVNVFLKDKEATISIDLSGDSLHRRGYRTMPGAAPLKENLAAAILYRSNWLEFAKENKPLCDPMCGSGTILIEGAMMALDYAPGLLRKSFGFSKWLGHDQKVWDKLLSEAKERHQKGTQNFQGMICGSDIDPKVVSIARGHIKAAGLKNVIKISIKDIKEISPSVYGVTTPGLLVANPPYGKRLSELEDLSGLYKVFGKVLRESFLDWEMVMLTGNPDLGKVMGIRSHKRYNFFNGTIPCKLLLFNIIPPMFWREYKGA